MDVKQLVVKAVTKVTGATALDPSMTLEELGVDSIGRVWLLYEMEEALAGAIPESALEGIRTVQDIIDRVQSHAARV